MKAVKTAETPNELSILYTIMADQASESQLDNYYMNTAMKLAMNIVTEYELSLEEEESM